MLADVEGGQHDLGQCRRGVDHQVVAVAPQHVEDAGDVGRADAVGLGRVLGGGQHAEAALVGDEELVEMLAEVEVGVVAVAVQGVVDRVVGPQPQRRRHLAELQVEVDQDHPLPGVAGQEQRHVGGHEGLAAAAGGGADGEHLGLGRHLGADG